MRSIMDSGQSAALSPEPSDEVGAPEQASESQQPNHTKRFRRAANAINLTADQQRRQAEAMTFGWRLLGSREAVMAFFNTHSDALEGRPLDLAINSDEGLARVERALREEAAVPVGVLLSGDVEGIS